MEPLNNFSVASKYILFIHVLHQIFLEQGRGHSVILDIRFSCPVKGKKGKVCIWAKLPIRPALISGFCCMKRLGVFLFSLDGMLVHCRVTPSIRFAYIHLYTWVERGTVRVKSLTLEHNTMSPARAQTWTA